MKREKEVPNDLLLYLDQNRQRINTKFEKQDTFCIMPVRAVRMKVLTERNTEEYRTVIIPSVKICVTGKAILKNGFLRRSALSYYVAGTGQAFPYGHIYSNTGFICLGSVFVPSAVPEKSPALPIETLFLHNDRNLNHGRAELFIYKKQADEICKLMQSTGIHLSGRAKTVTECPKNSLIAHDEIWILSADVAAQKPLPEALGIMSEVYDIVFKLKEKQE